MIIDCHAHVGISLKKYTIGQGGYGQTIKELLLRMEKNKIDKSIVFPVPEIKENKITN